MDTKSNDDSGGSDSLDKSMQSKCVMVDTSSAASEADNCSRDSAALRETPPPGEPKTDVSSANSHNDSHNNNNTTAANVAFETKVKLISQNLKETTLAERVATEEEVPEEEEPSATDECDNRVKKVHFHPDVKENDGGNRVKKKRRSPHNNNNNNNNANLSCDGVMEDGDEDSYDDENEDGQEFGNYDDDDVEDEAGAGAVAAGGGQEEEEFNLAKTIAEADDYLKQHPLTFIRRVELNGERLRDGLLSKVDVDTPQTDRTPDQIGSVDRKLKKNHDNEDSFYKKCKPENGIERVLGKETKAGKVEFLLRYENQGGLFWESEEYIRRMCPTLLKAYEKNRERRQQRLMHHVAKRQSLRQRYTDF